MAFKDASKVWNVVSSMLQAAQPRARNRSRINGVFNGNPPFTEDEARDNRIETNVNFLEGTRIIHSARQRFSNAFLKPQNYFNVTLDAGPRFKRMQWGNIITKNLNRVLKRSTRYGYALESQFAGTVLHGIGPVTWMRDRDWCPVARGIEDILVPTNTLTSLENLSHFAIYTSFTAADLIKMTRGKNVDKGWNLKLVNEIIAYLTKTDAIQQQSQDWAGQYFPEKVEEDFKENAGYWGSDATPVLRCYDFYFLDTSGDNPTWRRRIVVDQYNTGIGNVNTANQFLFDPGDRCYGKEVSHLMHAQFADGAVVPPFRWHSVRSLGYLLYAPCHLQNRLRCKFTDSVFEQMLWLFRATSDGDAERLEKVDLFNLGVIPDGLTWVPQAERHVLDQSLLSAAFSMNRQLMAESAATYQSDVDNGTAKEQTATEVVAKMESVNAMVGAMLTKAYTQQAFQYREIARRFATIDHPDCVDFRRRCLADGVDEAVLRDSDTWDIMPERVMGAGNKMLEIAQADRLMAVRPLLAPDAQAEVVHMYVEANTDDPLLANKLAPTEVRTPSPAVERATLAWGTLIDGKPVVLSSAINRPEYISTLLQLLTAEVEGIEQNGGMTDMKRLIGLSNVMAHIQQQMQLIAEDPGQQQNLKIFGDALGEISNLVKALGQRMQAAAEQQAEAAAANGGMSPEAQAKIQAMIITAQSKAEIAAANAEQKRMQKEIAFQQEQQRKNVNLLNEAQRQGAVTRADIAALDMETAAAIRRNNVTPTTPTE
jgi:hypothetical protein